MDGNTGDSSACSFYQGQADMDDPAWLPDIVYTHDLGEFTMAQLSPPSTMNGVIVLSCATNDETTGQKKEMYFPKKTPDQLPCPKDSPDRYPLDVGDESINVITHSFIIYLFIHRHYSSQATLTTLNRSSLTFGIFFKNISLLGFPLTLYSKYSCLYSLNLYFFMCHNVSSISFY